MLRRRTFLKASALSLGASTTMLNANTNFYDIKQIPHATHFGAFSASVNNKGYITELKAHESDKRPSVITKAIVDRTFSNTRVKYPYVRKSFLEGKNEPTLRGKEPFVRVSWEKAFELLERELKKHKPENIFNASYGGWGHVGLLHNCNAVAGRFFNTVLGGAIGTDGEYSNGAAGKVNTSICGDLEVYSLQTSYQVMLDNCEVYVMWGCDIFKNNQIDFKVANRENDEWLKKYAANKKMQFINIDPQYTDAAKITNAKWIKIKPNTDIALILGMCNYLYVSGKYNKEFIEKYTDGFNEFLPYLLGKSDGINKDVKWASKICGIDEKTIISLCDLFVSKRTFLAGNWANQRAQYGENADWAIITLACMIGQVGLAGGGFGFAMHYCSAGGAFSGALLPVGLAQGKNSIGINIPASRVSECILNPNKTINFKGKTFTYPQIKMFYVAGASVLGHHPNTNELIYALRTLDCVVVHEPWWTPMAKMADIVIPSTTTLERDDISFGGSYSQDWVYAMKKVVQPIGESKDDYDVFYELAKRFGQRELAKFSGGKTKQEWIKSFYEKSDCANEMDFDEFWQKGSMHFQAPKENYSFVRHADFRKDPVNNKLSTESGKIQIYSKKFANLNLPDFKGHIVWQEPVEYLGNKKLTQKFPFHMLSPHPRYRIHSQLDNTWIANLYKIDGREPMLINTNDAKKLGIKNKEIVEVYNDRGRILVGAILSDDILEGVISIQEGAWYEPENTNEDMPRCNSGHVNVLTSSRPSSQMAQATSVNSCLVAIKKIDNQVLKAVNRLPELIG